MTSKYIVGRFGDLGAHSALNLDHSSSVLVYPPDLPNNAKFELLTRCFGTFPL